MLGFLRSLAVGISIATCALTAIRPLDANAADRYVYPGAIIRAHGNTSALGSVNAAFKGQPPAAGFAVEKIGSGLLHIKELAQKRGTVSISSTTSTTSKTSIERPYKYSRATDLCRRAKFRRLKAAVGGHLSCSPNWAVQANITPNDTYYPQQYAPPLMQLPNAWDITTGDNTQIAVVIDTGVDYNHPDLLDNIWQNPLEVAGNGRDDDRNGYIDDIYGINAITNTGDPLDDHGHGTHVAGIIGARGNNARGIAGVSWNSKIVAAKFLDSTGSGSTANAIKAINYAVALKRAGRNVVVANNSWGGSSYSSALATAIEDANAAGILFVVAAGNSGTNNDTSPQYPANYTSTNIISVASVDSSSTLSSFSNYGQQTVHIAAPGSSIASTMMNGTYVYMSGTSMAAPQVSGVALLVQARCNGTLPIALLRSTVVNTGSVIASLAGKISSASIVNASEAIRIGGQLCAPTATPTSTPTATPTPRAEATNTPTSTPTPTPPPFATPTPPGDPIVATPTPTATPEPTSTPSRTPTSTPSFTPTMTNTPTVTPTRTYTPTRTPTRTPLPTSTPKLRAVPKSFAMTPRENLLSGSELSLEIQGPKRAPVLLRVGLLNNQQTTNYLCPNMRFNVSDTERISFSISLPAEIQYFKRITAITTMDNWGASQISLTGGTAMNPATTARATAVCNAFIRGLQRAAARARSVGGIRRLSKT